MGKLFFFFFFQLTVPIFLSVYPPVKIYLSVCLSNWYNVSVNSISVFLLICMLISACVRLSICLCLFFLYFCLCLLSIYLSLSSYLSASIVSVLLSMSIVNLFVSIYLSVPLRLLFLSFCLCLLSYLIVSIYQYLLFLSFCLCLLSYLCLLSICVYLISYEIEMCFTTPLYYCNQFINILSTVCR